MHHVVFCFVYNLRITAENILFFRPLNERRTPAENMAIIKMYGGVMFPNINDLTETPIGKK